MRPRARLARFLKCESGASAAEMALWSLLLIVPIASVADLGIYAVRFMQTDAAAQAGAQAARRTCWNKTPPLSTSCTGMTSAVTSGIQSTSLGTRVTLGTNYPKEGYYCPNSSQVLTLAGGTSSEGYPGAPPTKPSPFTCSGVTTGSTAYPGTYVKVMANTPYRAVFPSVSIASLLPTTITRVAWIRTN